MKKVKAITLCVILGAVTGMLNVHEAAAQKSNASLEETKAFILEKLVEWGDVDISIHLTEGDRRRATSKNVSPLFNGCTLSYTEVKTSEYFQSAYSRRENPNFTYPKDSTKENSISVPLNEVVLPNDGLETFANLYGDGGYFWLIPRWWVSQNGKRSKESAMITFASEETRNRMKAAFEHAIKLCGGKTEPF